MKFGFISLKPVDNLEDDINEYNNIIGNKFSYVVRFTSFEDDFPLKFCEKLDKQSLCPILTWEVFFPTENGNNRRDCEINETYLDDLLNGRFDQYIDKFASQAKLWNKLLLIRLLHEFNADWYTWGGGKNGGPSGGPEKVRKSWIYIIDRFRKIGAENVKWIWCPHEPSAEVSSERWNRLENYWPGDDYVDYLGIDGFNFYPENPMRENPDFLTFDSLFSEIYKEITALSNKPMFIMTGSGEFSYDGNVACKADWINDAFDAIKKSYPQIHIFCWFHHKFNENTNWRLDSSPEALNAFKIQLNKLV